MQEFHADLPSQTFTSNEKHINRIKTIKPTKLRTHITSSKKQSPVNNTNVHDQSKPSLENSFMLANTSKWKTLSSEMELDNPSLQTQADPDLVFANRPFLATIEQRRLKLPQIIQQKPQISLSKSQYQALPEQLQLEVTNSAVTTISKVNQGTTLPPSTSEDATKSIQVDKQVNSRQQTPAGKPPLQLKRMINGDLSILDSALVQHRTKKQTSDVVRYQNIVKKRSLSVVDLRDSAIEERESPIFSSSVYQAQQLMGQTQKKVQFTSLIERRDEPKMAKSQSDFSRIICVPRTEETRQLLQTCKANALAQLANDRKLTFSQPAYQTTHETVKDSLVEQEVEDKQPKKINIATRDRELARLQEKVQDLYSFQLGSLFKQNKSNPDDPCLNLSQEQQTNEICHCAKSYSEIFHLLSQSTFLSVFDQHTNAHLQEFQDRPPNRDRIELVVLEKLLDQIMKGKYNQHRDDAKFDQIGAMFTDNYIGGLEPRVLLPRAQAQYGEQELNKTFSECNETALNERRFKETFEKWFDLAEQTRMEQWLSTLLESSKEEIVESQELNGFLLIKAFQQKQTKNDDHPPSSEECQPPFHEHFHQWVKDNSMRHDSSEATVAELEGSKRAIMDEAHKFCEQMSPETKDRVEQVESFHKSRLSFFMAQNSKFKDILTQIDQQAEDCFNGQSKFAPKDQLLYLSFLETVRQVSLKSKGLALLLVKIWHGFQDCQIAKVASIFASIKQQLKTTETTVGKMVSRFISQVTEEENREREILKVKDKYEKALKLLEVATAELQAEQQRHFESQTKYEQHLKQLEFFFPHYQRYYNDKDSQRRLLEFDVKRKEGTLKKTDLHILFEEELRHQATVYPEEALLVDDLCRIKRLLKSRMLDEFNFSDGGDKVHTRLQEENNQLSAKSYTLMKQIKTQKKEIFELQHRIETLQREHTHLQKIASNLQETKNRLQQLLGIKDETVAPSFQEQEVQTDQIEVDNSTLVKMKGFSDHELNLLLAKAARTNPMFINNLYRPMKAIAKKVLAKKSDAVGRQIKPALALIGEILQKRVDVLHDKESAINKMNLDEFFYNYLTMIHGQGETVDRNCEQWLVTFQDLAKTDSRVDLFKRFMGMSANRNLSPAIFRFYLQMLKASNVDLKTIFNPATNLNEVLINYNLCFGIIRERIDGMDAFLRATTYNLLRKAIRVTSTNPVLNSSLDIQTYEVYRELQERSQLGKTGRSITELLVTLFNDNQSKLQDNLKRRITNLKAKNNEQPSPRTESPEERQKRGINQDIESDHSPDKQNRPLNLLKRTFTTKLLNNGERCDSVTFEEVKAFLIDELQLMPHERCFQKLDQILELFIMKAQNVESPKKLIRSHLLRGFSEIMDLKISVEAFIHIGINVIVDSSNIQSQWYEKIFGFYSRIFPAGTDQYNPHSKLWFANESSSGLEYGQFFLFCKDGGSKTFSNADVCFELYCDTVLYYNRQLLGLDNFVELIVKHGLIENKRYLEQNLIKRREQFALAGVDVTTATFKWITPKRQDAEEEEVETESPSDPKVRSNNQLVRKMKGALGVKAFGSSMALMSKTKSVKIVRQKKTFMKSASQMIESPMESKLIQTPSKTNEQDVYLLQSAAKTSELDCLETINSEPDSSESSLGRF